MIVLFEMGTDAEAAYHQRRRLAPARLLYGNHERKPFSFRLLEWTLLYALPPAGLLAWFLLARFRGGRRAPVLPTSVAAATARSAPSSFAPPRPVEGSFSVRHAPATPPR